MLWTLFVALLVLWALGLITGNVMGGFVHLLLLAAVVILLVNLISRRTV